MPGRGKSETTPPAVARKRPADAQTRSALVTGTAGFVGRAAARRLLEDGWQVGGFDAVPERAGRPVPERDSLSPAASFRIVNIGSSEPVELMDLIAAVEAVTERKIEKRMLPMQSGDVPASWTRLLERPTGRRSATPIATGMRRLVEYRGWTGA